MTASTIIVARDDLSIPGADVPPAVDGSSDENEARFFGLVRDHRPDAILLAASRNPARATAAIGKIRRRCTIPILVGCEDRDPATEDYRRAGAADCLPMPVDIRRLQAKLQQIAATANSGPRTRAAVARASAWRA